MNQKKEEKGEFAIILLGIIFDPKRRKILIGRRENDFYVPQLTWCFPGGRASHNEDLEQTMKKKINLKTGLEVANLGSVFSKIYPEKKDLVAIYYLCEVVGGKEAPADDLVELKWVAPEELEKYSTTSLHPRLKEYILNLK